MVSIAEPDLERSPFADLDDACVSEHDRQPSSHVSLQVRLEMLVKRPRFASDAEFASRGHPTALGAQKGHHGLEALPCQSSVPATLAEKQYDAVMIDGAHLEGSTSTQSPQGRWRTIAPPYRGLDWTTHIGLIRLKGQRGNYSRCPMRGCHFTAWRRAAASAIHELALV